MTAEWGEIQGRERQVVNSNPSAPKIKLPFITCELMHQNLYHEGNQRVQKRTVEWLLSGRWDDINAKETVA